MAFRKPGTPAGKSGPRASGSSRATASAVPDIVGTYAKRRIEKDGGAWAVSDVEDAARIDREGNTVPDSTNDGNIDADANLGTVTIVGPMPDPRPGCRIRIVAPVLASSRYGDQWKYRDYEWLGFSDLRGLARHIADVCTGIGAKTADRVVERYGQDAIAHLRDDPAGCAAAVKGLRIDVARAASEALAKFSGVERLSVILRGAGIGYGRVSSLVKEFGVEHLLQRLAENPWLLADEVDGIGFATADALAMKLAHPADSPLRARSALVHYVREGCKQAGHCYLPAPEICAKIEKDGVVIPREVLDAAIAALPACDPDGHAPPAPPPEPDAETARLLSDDWIDLQPAERDAVRAWKDELREAADARESARRRNPIRRVDPKGAATGSAGAPLLTPAELLDAEATVRDRVREMLARPCLIRPARDVVGENERDAANTRAADGEIGHEAGGVKGYRLDPSQADALRLALAHNLTVVTGGPGTGKSTIARFVHTAHSPQNRVLFLAPTGKAAVRIRQAAAEQNTVVNSMTIHMALARAQGQKLDADVFAVDESSMIDSVLMARLLDALPDRAQLVLFGDVDQLPPVSPGCPFRDLITGGLVPVTRLRLIHRVRPTSWIATNARAINEGRTPNFMGDASGPPDDFFLVPRGDGGNAADDSAPAATVVDVVTRRIPAKIRIPFGEPDPATGGRPTRPADPRTDVQVISPVWEKGLCGVNELNRALQAAINPPQGPAGPNGLRPGDKVVQKKNDYVIGIMNGEVGVVAATGKKGDSIPRRWQQYVDGTDEAEVGIPVDAGEWDDGSGGNRDDGRGDALDGRNDLVQATAAWLIVDFGDGSEAGANLIVYRESQARPLQLAFAMTVHSCQGSQFPCVVVPIVRAHTWSWSKSLCYTAVTRAQRLVILVGEDAQIAAAVKNVKDTRRRTFLKAWLATAQAQATMSTAPAKPDEVPF